MDSSQSPELAASRRSYRIFRIRFGIMTVITGLIATTEMLMAFAEFLGPSDLIIGVANIFVWVALALPVFAIGMLAANGFGKHGFLGWLIAAFTFCATIVLISTLIGFVLGLSAGTLEGVFVGAAYGYVILTSPIKFHLYALPVCFVMLQLIAIKIRPVDPLSH